MGRNKITVVNIGADGKQPALIKTFEHDSMLQDMELVERKVNNYELFVSIADGNLYYSPFTLIQK